MQYDGANSMSSVNSIATQVYKVQIDHPGTYQFKWRTRRGFNAPAPDQYNDSWLKINGTDFYGMKNGSKIACKDHFIKVWVQNDVFGFNCWGEHGGTNGFEIFAYFEAPGEYSIEISGRSRYHVIDRMALYKPEKASLATSSSTPESPIGCGGHAPVHPPKPEEPDIIHVTDMYVAYDDLTLIEGEEYLLRHTILPDSAENKQMAWSVQNPSVISVDSTGLISALNTGYSRVYAASVDAGIRVYSTVLVLPFREKYLLDKNACTVIYADSEDSEKDGAVKENILDGDLSTYWHTQWFSDQAPLPHEIVIDLGSDQYLDIIDYYPRQDDWGPNGAIGSYEIYLSGNPDSWGKPIHKDQFTWAKYPTREDYLDMRRIFLREPAKGRYFRLVALTEAQKDPAIPFTAIAELDLWAYVRDLSRVSDLSQELLPEVYPNPFRETLKLSGLEHVEGILLLDLEGRELVSCPVEGQEKIELKTGQLNQGMYILRFDFANGSSLSKKVVKE
jgi:hypothetical protein